MRNEWQGVIYVVLDQLSDAPVEVGRMATAAIQHHKYHLALNLLRMLRRRVQEPSEWMGEQATSEHNAGLPLLLLKHCAQAQSNMCY